MSCSSQAEHAFPFTIYFLPPSHKAKFLTQKKNPTQDVSQNQILIDTKEKDK